LQLTGVQLAGDGSRIPVLVGIRQHAIYNTRHCQQYLADETTKLRYINTVTTVSDSV